MHHATKNGWEYAKRLGYSPPGGVPSTRPKKAGVARKGLIHR